MMWMKYVPLADQILGIEVRVGRVPEVASALQDSVEDLEPLLIGFGGAVECCNTHRTEADCGDLGIADFAGWVRHVVTFVD